MEFGRSGPYSHVPGVEMVSPWAPSVWHDLRVGNKVPSQHRWSPNIAALSQWVGLGKNGSHLLEEPLPTLFLLPVEQSFPDIPEVK